MLAEVALLRVLLNLLLKLAPHWLPSPSGSLLTNPRHYGGPEAKLTTITTTRAANLTATKITWNNIIIMGGANIHVLAGKIYLSRVTMP